MKMLKKCVPAILLAILGTSSAYAVTGNLDISAQVQNSCTAVSGTLDFGVVDPANAIDIDVAGIITVTCTAATNFNVSGNIGANSLSPLDRTMLGPSSALLRYNVYVDSGRTQLFGGPDAGFNTTGITATSDGSSSNVLDIYGRIPAGQQDLPDGNYSDTIILTVLTDY